MSAWVIRPATAADARDIADIRVEFLQESGARSNPDGVRRAVIPYLERTLSSGDVKAWLGTDDGAVIATGVMTIYERMNWDGVGKEGYILSMYTVPARRGEGIGSAIVDAMTEYAKDEEMRLCLIALDDARGLYERAGFRPDDRYMRWRP